MDNFSERRRDRIVRLIPPRTSVCMSPDVSGENFRPTFYSRPERSSTSAEEDLKVFGSLCDYHSAKNIKINYQFFFSKLKFNFHFLSNSSKLQKKHFFENMHTCGLSLP